MTDDAEIHAQQDAAAEFEEWFESLPNDDLRVQYNHAMGTHEKPDWPEGWYDTWPEGMRSAWDRLYGKPERTAG